MAVTPASESGVFRVASGVVLNGDARPVVHGVGEPVMAGLSSHHDAALARPLGDRRDSGQTAQRGVIPSLQGVESFCEQRGEDDPSHSRQGCEDFHVMLLPLPRPGLLRRNEPGGQGIELAMRFLELLVDSRIRAMSVVTCALAASIVPAATCTGGLRNTCQDVRGIEAPDAIALENLGDVGGGQNTHEAGEIGQRQWSGRICQGQARGVDRLVNSHSSGAIHGIEQGSLLR